MKRNALLVVALWLLSAPALASAQHVLVPMDRSQSNHLKAYGLTYWTLQQGSTAEWLLNYRGGSFLLAATPEVQRKAALMGVKTEPMPDAELARVRATIAESNMEAVVLEKAPKVAIYTPRTARPGTTP